MDAAVQQAIAIHVGLDPNCLAALLWSRFNVVVSILIYLINLYINILYYIYIYIYMCAYLQNTFLCSEFEFGCMAPNPQRCADSHVNYYIYMLSWGTNAFYLSKGACINNVTHVECLIRTDYCHNQRIRATLHRCRL